MSDAGQREWRFYLDDMIDFAGDDVPELPSLLKSLRDEPQP